MSNTINAGLNELMVWCKEGYAKIQKLDKEFSDEFAIPPSIKTTSIKPSGTVSLLAGGEICDCNKYPF
jgi:ribonucleoside-triphosphate reductase